MRQHLSPDEAISHAIFMRNYLRDCFALLAMTRDETESVLDKSYSIKRSSAHGTD